MRAPVTGWWNFAHQVRRRMNLDAMAVRLPSGVGKFPFGKLLSPQ
jgi:hypothetical protein